MKLKTSPPMSQTQHLNDCRSGLTCRLGRLIVVPGAETDIVAALAAERNVSADQVDDVGRLADLFLGVEVVIASGVGIRNGGCLTVSIRYCSAVQPL